MELLGKVDTVAKKLNISTSTLKKYYLLYEEEGYRFKRSNDGHVLFSRYDVELFEKLIALKNQPNMTIKKAVQQIVIEEGIAVTTDITDMTVMTNQITTVMTEIKEMKEMMNKQNELIERQQKYIDGRLKERDKKLVAALRTAQEERRIFLQEVAATIEKQQKKGFWARLFGK